MSTSADCSTIALVAPDLNGTLRTRYIPAGGFDPDRTPRFADIVFAFDEVDRLIPRPAGFAGWWPSWADGFGDLETRPDLVSRRPLGWRPGTDVIFADLHHASGDAVSVAPRQILRRVSERLVAGSRAAVIRFGVEIEFFLADRDGVAHPSAVGNAYAFSPPAADRATLEDVVGCLLASDVGVDSWYAEGGVRQYEIALAPTDPLAAADTVVLARQAIGEVAERHGLLASFRPKPGPGFGSGLHVHVSVEDATGGNPLRDLDDSGTGASLLAGVLAVLQPAAAIFSPTPEGFLRMAPHTAAGTTASWAHDNRSAGVRYLDRGDETRIEVRCAASDANPYLVVAAIAAGLADGADNDRPLPPASVGDVYDSASDTTRLSPDLAAAAALLAGDTVLTDRLGPEFVAHYAATRMWAADHADDGS